MNRISPVWILTSLTGEAFDKFKKAIDQQFKAFSETELNGFQNCATHRWWGVETTDGGLDGKWNPANGYPNDVPAYNLQQTAYDSQNHLVVYYAPLDDFTAQSKHIDSLKKNGLFLQAQRAGTFFYGITSFHKEKTADKNFFNLVRAIDELKETNNQPFSSITFLSDSSHEAGVNSNGYMSLNENDYLALVVNTIFSIAIAKRKLYKFNCEEKRLFNTAGVFSFTYEPDALKKTKAYSLSEKLLEAFCNNTQDAEWYSGNDAETHFDKFESEKYLHWRTIYGHLSQGFKEESLKGIYSKSDVSPWRMFAYKLVPEYFKKHLKPLLRKLYNNVHDFSSFTVMRYESFAKNKRKQMLDGSADIEDKTQFAKTAIAGYLSSVWSPDYKGAKGVQQVLLLLEKTKKYLEKQKDEIGRVKNFNSPNDEKYKSFPQLNDYPLTEIAKKGNEQYYKHYKEFATNGKPTAEGTMEADKSYEERQLSLLQKLLQWHAMPLNLFTKAGLLSALIFVAIWAGISIIQHTNLVHLFSLDTNQSLITLFVSTAVIVLTFAFVKYGLKTLRKIRLAVQKYIAWSYYRVQCEVYVISLKEAEKYYDELIKECDRIDAQLNAFVKSEVKNKPSFERYRISKFQRNILDKMDDGNQILNNTVLNVSLQINGNNYSPDEVVQGLFNAMLSNSERKLDDEMRDSLLKESYKESENNLKEELLKIWSDALAENITITINGQVGAAIDFPAFHHTNTSNFTTEAWQSANAIIHPSVYVYAMIPYKGCFSFIPHGTGHENGEKWENLFYGPDYVNKKVPDYSQVQNQGWFATKQIALFMRIHAYDRLIVKDKDDNETTIFNNQL